MMPALHQHHLLLISSTMTAAPVSYKSFDVILSTQLTTLACARLQMTTGPMMAIHRLQLIQALRLPTLAPHRVSMHRANSVGHAA